MAVNAKALSLKIRHRFKQFPPEIIVESQIKLLKNIFLPLVKLYKSIYKNNPISLTTRA